MKLFIVIAIASILFSCNEHTDKYVVTNDVMSQFTPDSGNIYFPADTSAGRTNILEDWANKVLFSMNEPDLKNYTGEGNFIRLTWLRAFENPIIIRSNSFGDTAYIVIKENNFSLNTSQKPQSFKDTIVNIDVKEWKQFSDQTNKKDFWNSTYNDSIIGKDGATWFLEYRTKDKYKVIQRWDDGYLTSTDLSKYLSNLTQQVNKYIQLKSSR